MIWNVWEFLRISDIRFFQTIRSSESEDIRFSVIFSNFQTISFFFWNQIFSDCQKTCKVADAVDTAARQGSKWFETLTTIINRELHLHSQQCLYGWSYSTLVCGEKKQWTQWNCTKVSSLSYRIGCRKPGPLQRGEMRPMVLENSQCQCCYYQLHLGIHFTWSHVICAVNCVNTWIQVLPVEALRSRGAMRAAGGSGRTAGREHSQQINITQMKHVKTITCWLTVGPW